MEREPFQPSRRSILMAGLSLASVSALSLLASGCAAPHKRRVEAYLPTTLPEPAYETIGHTLDADLRRIGRIPLAFAAIDPHAPRVEVPVFSPGLKRIIHASDAQTDLSLAIGGGDVEASLWEVAAADPTRFAASVNQARARTEDALQRPVHATLDCESSVSSREINQLTSSLRDALPSDRDLTVTVPVDNAAVQAAARGIKANAQYVHVMAYDQTGPWSSAAGPVTSWAWVSEGVSQWKSAMGGSSKLEIGYPTYGYKFSGAQAMGQPFQSATSVPYTQIPPSAIRDDTAQLTSEASIDGNVVSCVSPHVLGLIATKLAQAEPGLGGAFFWSMQGLTPEHLNAIGA